MLELLHRLSDDQLALFGCFGALVGSVLFLAVSFHANPANHRQAHTDREQPEERSAPRKAA